MKSKIIIHYYCFEMSAYCKCIYGLGCVLHLTNSIKFDTNTIKIVSFTIFFRLTSKSQLTEIAGFTELGEDANVQAVANTD